jgi:hypothetical protein
MDEPETMTMPLEGVVLVFLMDPEGTAIAMNGGDILWRIS